MTNDGFCDETRLCAEETCPVSVGLTPSVPTQWSSEDRIGIRRLSLCWAGSDPWGGRIGLP
jgi:hypothetical protein